MAQNKFTKCNNNNNNKNNNNNNNNNNSNAQEKALRTNLIKYIIDRTSETPLCSARLCGDATGTVRHIVNGCKVTQR